MALNMGTTIATRRLALGLTQRQLADKLGVTDKAVSKWERDQGYPDITMLNDLAAVLQINVADLLTGADHPAAQPSARAASNGPTSSRPEPALDAAIPKARRRFVLPRLDIRQLAGRLAALWRPITTVMCLTAIVACVIVDVAVNRRLTWSWIVVASVVAGWAVVMPLQPFTRGRVLISTLILTVATPALLAVIQTSIGVPQDTFWAIAWPVTLLGAVGLWLLVLLWFFTRIGWFYKIALTLALAAVGNFVISGTVARILAEHFPNTNTYVNALSTGFAAVVIAIIGVTLKRRRQVASPGVTV